MRDGLEHIEELWEIPGDALDDGVDLLAAGALSPEASAAHERLLGALDALVPVLDLVDSAP